MSLTEFGVEAESISSDIAAMSAAVQASKAAQERAAAAPSITAAAALRQQLSADLASIRQQAVRVRERIVKLQAENEARLRGGQVVHGKDRHRSAVTQSLWRKLKGATADLAALGAAMAATHRAEVERQVQIVTGEKLSAAELDRIMEAGGSEEVLKAAVEGQGSASSGGTAALREAVLEISVRHDAVKEVTKSLMELQQMFLDMATLVEAQGEALDSIESHVEGAVDHVAHARKELTTAEEIQKNTRKWRLITAGIVALVFLVIFIPVISSVARK